MSHIAHLPPVLGFAAYSGTGKTTLIVQLLPLLKQRGLRIGMIKHAHHSFDVDHSGKDSFELRHAGADRMLIGSRRRWALVVETPQANEPTLTKLLENMLCADLDLILVEGFKHERFPKIELHRVAIAQPWLYPDDDSIIAVATDSRVDMPEPMIPVLDINQPAAISQYILHWIAGKSLNQRHVAQQ